MYIEIRVQWIICRISMFKQNYTNEICKFLFVNPNVYSFNMLSFLIAQQVSYYDERIINRCTFEYNVIVTLTV